MTKSLGSMGWDTGYLVAKTLHKRKIITKILLIAILANRFLLLAVLNCRFRSDPPKFPCQVNSASATKLRNAQFATVPFFCSLAIMSLKPARSCTRWSTSLRMALLVESVALKLTMTPSSRFSSRPMRCATSFLSRAAAAVPGVVAAPPVA